MIRVLIAATLLLPAGAAAEAPTGLCATPRAAAQQFLDNLQPERFRPRDSIRCFEAPLGLEQEAMIRRASDLKAVLDARGLWVVMDDLSDKADHQDAQSRHRQLLVDGFASVELRRLDGQWLFPAEVVERVPRLYADTFSGWTEALLQRLPRIFQAKIFDFAIWQLCGLLLLLLLSVLISRLARALAHNRLRALAERWGITGRDALLGRTARPLGWLIGAGVVAMLLPELRFQIGAARVLMVGIRLVAAVSGVLCIYRVVDIVALRLESTARRTESRMDDQLVVLVRKSLRVITVAIGIVFVLQNLSIDVTSLVAGLGIGGLALALAAKDTAANLFGSVTIFVDAPFYVGDWIAAAGVEGTVIEIGLRSTRVRTFHSSVVSVPNSLLATSTIDNMSRREYRRLSTRLCIGYESTSEQILAFVEGVRAIIAAHPATRKDAYEVHFVDYAESWLEVMLYTFFDVDTWSDELSAKQDVLLQIKRLAEDIGVSFAFPTQTLHVDSMAVGQAPAKTQVPGRSRLREALVAFGPEGAQVTPIAALTEHRFLPGTELARGPDEEGE